VGALVELVVDLGGARRRDAVVSFELYLAAARDPALRAVTQAWTTDCRAVLAGLWAQVPLRRSTRC